MVIDFGDIKEVVKPLIDEHLDHYYLNEVAGLENPTSENLARWVWRRLAPGAAAAVGGRGTRDLHVRRHLPRGATSERDREHRTLPDVQAGATTAESPLEAGRRQRTPLPDHGRPPGRQQPADDLRRRS